MEKLQLDRLDLIVPPGHSGTAFAQAAQPSSTPVINGQTGKARVIQQNGRTSVDVGALAQVANGSLSFSPGRIALTIPPLPLTGLQPQTAPRATNDSSLSPRFMKAGIEGIGLLRGWVAPVANAVQNGYPLNRQWVTDYQQ